MTHPIVFSHGFFGFAEMVGIEYFRGVKNHLERKFHDVTVIVTEAEGCHECKK